MVFLIYRSAEDKKEAGNQLYKAKKYLEALSKYSEAIDLCPECPAYYGNRAACHMMLSQYQKALDDAKTAVNLDSNFVKGYVRIAKCCVALGEIPSAKQVRCYPDLHYFCISDRDRKESTTFLPSEYQCLRKFLHFPLVTLSPQPTAKNETLFLKLTLLCFNCSYCIRVYSLFVLYLVGHKIFGILLTSTPFYNGSLSDTK